jgi:hypothetical protein
MHSSYYLLFLYTEINIKLTLSRSRKSLQDKTLEHNCLQTRKPSTSKNAFKHAWKKGKE